MNHLYLKFIILVILLITQPIKITYADVVDNATTIKLSVDNSTSYNSTTIKPVLDNTTVNTYPSYRSARGKYALNKSNSYKSTIDSTITNGSRTDNVKTDNSTDLSSLFMNIGFSTDLFITDSPFDLDTATLLFCGNIDVGKVIHKAFGIGIGYSNCNGSGSSAHKLALQLLLQRKIDKNKLALTPFLTAGIKYQYLKRRISTLGAFNAFGTNASIGIRYNIYTFIISAEIDFTYTLFFRESSSPTHALVASALIKIGILF